MHNSRSELASAQVNGETYGYDYDNIGNRRMAMEASDYAFYEANNLNQYSSIQRNEEEAFVPTFDADGNQTLVRTSTGIWAVSYNAENRPVIFQKITDTVTTRITCTYDSMGRRATKKVEEITTDTEGNEVTAVISDHRFIYRGYLQIACCDLTRTAHPCLWLITWDPTQPVATRPLAIQKDGTWFCYGWDLTKNICEIFGPNGYIRTAYTYTPYGSVTVNGDITQPLQWSSEYADTELALVYYNYRHYNPMDGRWLGREPIGEEISYNRYSLLENKSIKHIDCLGLFIDTIWDIGNMAWDIGKIVAGAVQGDKDLLEKGATDLAFDTAAALIPGVPAGIPKIGRKIASEGAETIAKRTKKTKAKTKKRNSAPPGNCTKIRHRKLQHKVNYYKKLKGCKGNQSCSELKENLQNKINLYNARRLINNECFNGGDKNHTIALKEAQNAIMNCYKYIESKCRCKRIC